MKKSEIIMEIMSVILLTLFIMGLFKLAFTGDNSGHYEATNTIQPDGSYYIYVED